MRSRMDNACAHTSSSVLTKSAGRATWWFAPVAEPFVPTRRFDSPCPGSSTTVWGSNDLHTYRRSILRSIRDNYVGVRIITAYGRPPSCVSSARFARKNPRTSRRARSSQPTKPQRSRKRKHAADAAARPRRDEASRISYHSQLTLGGLSSA
jgi:hypothetical protein